VSKFRWFLVSLTLIAIILVFAVNNQWLQKRGESDKNLNSASLEGNYTSPNQCLDWKVGCQPGIDFYQLDKAGKLSTSGSNLAIIFDPKSPKLDFKVNLPVVDNLETKTSLSKQNLQFVPKKFGELISDQNSLLNSKKPIAGINTDYVDTSNYPQGLDIIRGQKYLGDFATIRSSFGISKGGAPSIQIGSRQSHEDNYNVTGGNGRFYTNGIFKDICQDLGTYACKESTERSMAVITSKQLVIFLLHKSTSSEILLPADFELLLQNLGQNLGVGSPIDGMLFDGGASPSIFFKNQIVAGPGNIGAVFLIYEKKPYS
jgi:hypothetical protein